MRLVFAILVVLAAEVAAVPPEDAELFGQVLGEEDECDLEGGEEGCSLNAIQRRSRRRNTVDSDIAHEVAPEHTGSWVQIRRCSGDEFHELAFVVRPKNAALLEDRASDLTNPRSPNYRRWLSRAEVSALTRNDEALLELHAHLREHPQLSVLSESRDGELLRVHGPVAAWERLLRTEFFMYKHEDHEAEIIRSPNGYFLPGALKEAVAGVLGALDFDELRPHKIESWELHNAVGENPRFGYASFEEMVKAKGDNVVSPPKLREIYGAPRPAPRGSRRAAQRSNTSQVVFGTLSQHWSPADRTDFQSAFDIIQDNYVKQLKGQEVGNSMSSDDTCRLKPNSCAEANLDVQYMMSMSPWSQIGYWYVPKANAKGLYTFLNDFLTHFVEHDRPPQVISISYGMPEYFVSKSSLDLFEVLAKKLALQGTTILVASGDDGAASFLARKMRRGKECWSVDMIGFQVSWPSSSLWVTGVGATTGPASGRPEVACQTNYSGLGQNDTPAQITSGGGYSKAFSQPSWQEGVHNETGRGVPDVALLGHNYAMVVGGRWVTADGTSASAPTLGGMLSLINAQLIHEGEPPIGFLNQLLYQNATSELFNDIVVGDNRCAAIGAPCCGGYDAGPGWDPVTGLGSPNIRKLRALLLVDENAK